jgi:hypothetical protein
VRGERFELSTTLRSQDLKSCPFDQARAPPPITVVKKKNKGRGGLLPL